MKRIAIIGAGQSGLQLGIGLLGAGYEVTLYSDRSAEEIRSGRVMSSQCMFDSALETERNLGLNYWEQECPKVDGISFSVPDFLGGKVIDWAARLDNFAQSVDQRLKIPRWMTEFQKRGGKLQIKAADVDILENCARSHDLVIVASGKGALGQLFERDTKRSPFLEPQRALALTYVRGMRPREPYHAVCFNLIPNTGEYFVFPALTTSGRCEIMVFEGVPGGPMDCWKDVQTPEEHLAKSKWILESFMSWEAERCQDVELTDDNGILAGHVVPTVRHPIGILPSGRKILAMADAVVLNDPITGQGSNNAALSAEIYLESILERGAEPADADWMQQTFDRYWTGYARWVVDWTNLLLRPPSHVIKLLDRAGKISAVGSALVNGFDDPRTLYPWFMDAAAAEKFVQQEAKAVAERFDRRDYRRALGQFATGVTVVTARASPISIICRVSFPRHSRTSLRESSLSRAAAARRFSPGSSPTSFAEKFDSTTAATTLSCWGKSRSTNTMMVSHWSFTPAATALPHAIQILLNEGTGGERRKNSPGYANRKDVGLARNQST